MNPPNNEVSAGMQLPSPVMEQAPANGSPEAPQTGMEQAPASSAERLAAAQSSAAGAVPTMPSTLPASAPMAQQGGVNTTTQSAGLPVADDGDLIEKEWVLKAKAIVNRNRDDPYKQSEELTVFKADYMKQRYNKTIKLNK